MKLTEEMRIQRAHLKLMKHPETALYAGIMLWGTSTVCDTTPTAYTDGCNKVYGREFVKKLNDKEYTRNLHYKFGESDKTYYEDSDSVDKEHLLFKMIEHWERMLMLYKGQGVDITSLEQLVDDLHIEKGVDESDKKVHVHKYARGVLKEPEEPGPAV